MLDKFTFTAYAFRILKDTEFFSVFDRILIHKAMTKGDSTLTEEESIKFDLLVDKVYRHMLKLPPRTEETENE